MKILLDIISFNISPTDTQPVICLAQSCTFSLPTANTDANTSSNNNKKRYDDSLSLNNTSHKPQYSTLIIPNLCNIKTSKISQNSKDSRITLGYCKKNLNTMGPTKVLSYLIEHEAQELFIYLAS